ncbi:helix-turn-helix transcriptional regulator [Jiangella alkaliphila]|uniref:Helix-turn-helix domain-containing protein n=1 Tax=Jiangella alkaliphila TaxID=419479 RepID=A0A1H2IXX7_9ACTN|nr:helix-turn-helix transcriptional regulator [Jiangella alkaliphila]SDU48990.1 Helix-turn-helix domain-containing protein [Jiangella alkaliphila]
MDRTELAAFLRSRRAHVRPVDVGLTAGRNRRTPGLRREEVAQLTGISADYYIRLEQARGPHPSAQVVEALARALRLTGDERAHLFHLTGRAPLPSTGPRRDVPAGILHLLERLDDSPAVVIDAKYDVLAWNPMWAALMAVDPAGLPLEQLNSLRGFFSPAAAAFAAEHTQFAREAVADLRAAAARYPRDAELRRLIGDLTAGSALFRDLWDRHEVDVRRSTHKRVVHPVVGVLELDCETLLIPDRDQRLVLYTAAPGTPSHQALQLLKVVGLQDLRA